MGDYAELAIVVGRNATTFAPVVMTSPDGITWTEVPSWPGVGAFGVVVAGDTYFVNTAGGSTDNLATSTDGITWTLQSGPVSGGMAWTGTKFVAAVGNASYTSTTGTTWTSAGATGTTHNSRRILHVGGVTVTTGLGGGGSTAAVAYSTDEGTSWSTYTPSSGSNGGQDLAYGAGRWVIPRRRISGSPADVGVITSTDGTSWSVVDTGIALNNGWYHASYAKGVFLLLGVTNTGGAAVATSTTGAANSYSVFTPTGLPSTISQGGMLEFWNGRWLHVSSTTGVIYSSTDGVTWSSTTFSNRVWTDISAGVARPRGRRGLGLIRG